jgi:hypothetical protein
MCTAFLWNGTSTSQSICRHRVSKVNPPANAGLRSLHYWSGWVNPPKK